MNSSAWAVVVVVILLVIVGIVGYQASTNNVDTTVPNNGTNINVVVPPTGTNGQGQQAPQTHSVSYTNGGFSPSNLTIRAGDTVNFVNNSSSTMWVASDPHPTHNTLPAFDAKSALAAGGMYSFKFDQAGSWGFHNHRNANHSGTVTVQQ